jgi:nicotinate-nucleotide adenylyltransferase
MPKLIGILGGTFNPIHNGHLSMATVAYQHCHLDHVLMLPNRIPVHRDTPKVSTADRLAMIQLAIENLPYVSVSDCELARSGPSYMVDTLTLLNKKYPHDHLCLIIGEDSLEHFPTWHAYKEILSQAHLVIFPRAPYNAIKKVPSELSAYTKTADVDLLFEHESSVLLTMDTAPIDICSTNIRTDISAQTPKSDGNLPRPVLAYIKEKQLYKGI